jgi:hypothetical protein
LETAHALAAEPWPDSTTVPADGILQQKASKTQWSC